MRRAKSDGEKDAGSAWSWLARLRKPFATVSDRISRSWVEMGYVYLLWLVGIVPRKEERKDASSDVSVSSIRWK